MNVEVLCNNEQLSHASVFNFKLNSHFCSPSQLSDLEHSTITVHSSLISKKEQAVPVVVRILHEWQSQILASKLIVMPYIGHNACGFKHQGSLRQTPPAARLQQAMHVQLWSTGITVLIRQLQKRRA